MNQMSVETGSTGGDLRQQVSCSHPPTYYFGDPPPDQAAGAEFAARGGRRTGPSDRPRAAPLGHRTPPGADGTPAARTTAAGGLGHLAASEPTAANMSCWVIRSTSSRVVWPFMALI